jgi:hypothetical protein
MLKEVSCGTCISACCRRGMKFDLTPDEAEFMRLSGTELQELAPPEPAPRKRRFLPLMGVVEHTVPDGKQTYRLETDCSNVVETEDGQTLCGAYADPNRPEVCSDFLEGSYHCRGLRALAEVDTSADFQLYLDLTAGA